MSLLLALLACATEPVVEAPPQPVDPEPEVLPTGVEPSVRADLRLKRWRQISLDLQGALALTPDQICRETGLYDCMDLHGVSMGGVNIASGIYEPVEDLSVTTSLAMERVVLQACHTRLTLDREALAAGGAAVVFAHVDLDGGVALGEAPDRAEAQVTELYRRLLARDPQPEELAASLRLYPGVLAEGGGDAEWALMLCFALGTSTEALLY